MKRKMFLVAMVAVASAVALFIAGIHDADINDGETADESMIDYVGV